MRFTNLEAAPLARTITIGLEAAVMGAEAAIVRRARWHIAVGRGTIAWRWRVIAWRRGVIGGRNMCDPNHIASGKWQWATDLMPHKIQIVLTATDRAIASAELIAALGNRAGPANPVSVCPKRDRNAAGCGFSLLGHGNRFGAEEEKAAKCSQRQMFQH